MLLLIAAVSLLSAAEPSAAAAKPAEPTTASADLKPGERKVRLICRKEVATGTRFGKRVCMTVEDFNRRQAEAEQGLAEMQRDINTPRPKGN
ncbi:hypothetical protein [Phenylobacterium sp.]|uniref:hypothetical protein n=1 Tax=Phenylobacterium sp. TaxID=1871053 RepID=UPI00286B011A|nr:hypothetical protein [Phenylobacterium sp.]